MLERALYCSALRECTEGGLCLKPLRTTLTPEEMPKKWYNILPDLPEPIAPPLNPATKMPISPKDLEVIFPKALIAQEMSPDRYIDIPDEVLQAYMIANRPSPLQRAERLERLLKTPAKIYYKREDLSPGGSHKTNTSLAQAYYNMKEGVEKLTTETGAGQWGTALSLACNHFGLGCQVFMVRASYDQKPYRREMMRVYGADVHPSPSTITDFGNKMLAKDPKHPGSLGIAISEALEAAIKGGSNTKYSLGSVLNHVMMHQTIVGEETMLQFEKLDERPDYMIGCVGGGSNFAGFVFPFIGEQFKKKTDTQFIAVEPTVVPSLTKGKYEYDFGDTAGMTPLLLMYTLGHDFVPSPIHAGGLRYHGAAPTVSMLVKKKVIKPVSYQQKEVFDAAIMFARSEGLVPAPETNHAIKAAIDLALEAKKKNEKKIIAFNYSGHGLLDLAGYQNYLDGNMV
ncbi:MAG: TrpB-like pyridoxal phosphate-dependent enzyme [Candidatus Thermoplasmatota archaeon]|nr:TrpB-like pyridoxal phosphate-dependent enzyme [Candidatus Thermoplasmatota archaeon]